MTVPFAVSRTGRPNRSGMAHVGGDAFQLVHRRQDVFRADRPVFDEGTLIIRCADDRTWPNSGPSEHDAVGLRPVAASAASIEVVNLWRAAVLGQTLTSVSSSSPRSSKISNSRLIAASNAGSNSLPIRVK